MALAMAASGGGMVIISQDHGRRDHSSSIQWRSSCSLTSRLLRDRGSNSTSRPRAATAVMTFIRVKCVS
eukprot:CAMPEP_0204624340 /NCGR_PEP_ID=MMETSP0717-20131115/10097_1 /ASSEMBLY_ACC=CAM_ASM_000666 /TAXON_ID=230516 /ORGANISM="Chaetoceros curvisetus" /LENGTH=68 /DNA_ID=CAMNT_0051639699 /DNA_START=287 /DNA_END=489 /DNA_ORIENTATION=-